MAVKKPATAKKAAAKKTAPTTKTKKTASKGSTGTAVAKKKSEPDKDGAFVKNLATAIVDGRFDAHLVVLDDALTARVNANAAAKKKAAAPAAPKGERKVTPPPKKSKSKVEPVEGKRYKIGSASKNLAGATVKFHRFKVDSADKSVVEMVTDKPGYPKGKRVVIPTTLLEEIPKKK